MVKPMPKAFGFPATWLTGTGSTNTAQVVMETSDDVFDVESMSDITLVTNSTHQSTQVNTSYAQQRAAHDYRE